MPDVTRAQTITLSDGHVYDAIQFNDGSMTLNRQGTSEPPFRFDSIDNLEAALTALVPVATHKVLKVQVLNSDATVAFDITVMASGDLLWQQSGSSFSENTPGTPPDIMEILAALRLVADM